MSHDCPRTYNGRKCIYNDGHGSWCAAYVDGIKEPYWVWDESESLTTLEHRCGSKHIVDQRKPTQKAFCVYYCTRVQGHPGKCEARDHFDQHERQNLWHRWYIVRPDRIRVKSQAAREVFA